MLNFTVMKTFTMKQELSHEWTTLKTPVLSFCKVVRSKHVSVVDVCIDCPTLESSLEILSSTSYVCV